MLIALYRTVDNPREAVAHDNQQQFSASSIQSQDNCPQGAHIVRSVYIVSFLTDCA